MNNINIIKGDITIVINEDPNRTVTFNPNSIEWVNNFYEIVAYFKQKIAEYENKLKELEKDKTVDEFGIPNNMGDSLKLTKQIAEDLRVQLDKLFGEGTCNTVFGKEMQLDMFEQFFNGITPYIAAARGKKIEKYTGNRAQRRSAGKVMR